MSEEIRKHPLNAKGKYYVNQNDCIWCAACEEIATNNFKVEDPLQNNYEFGSYVFKQPENFEEEKQCKEAMLACPVEAVHDDGK